jgi:hypothetical protein
MAVAVAAIGKDASAMMAMMPVQQEHWHWRSNSKDASNRCNTAGNNQPVQQKGERTDKMSGLEGATKGNRVVDDTIRGRGLTMQGGAPPPGGVDEGCGGEWCVL